jgi:hypothetical protein
MKAGLMVQATESGYCFLALLPIAAAQRDPVSPTKPPAGLLRVQRAGLATRLKESSHSMGKNQ